MVAANIRFYEPRGSEHALPRHVQVPRQPIIDNGWHRAMKRRTLLAAGAATLSAASAGCLGELHPGCGGGSAGTAQSTPGEPEQLPVPESELVRAARRDEIPAITEPAFGPDWEGIVLTGVWWGTGEEFDFTVELLPNDRIIGVVRDGYARAYPLKLLHWHEAVNDEFGGPLLVTFCPLCGSAITAERVVDGQTTLFGVSGLLYRSNLVLYDQQTNSLWAQLLAKAIRGPQTGSTFSLVPSELTTWETWQQRYPETEVLLPAPLSGTVGVSEAAPYNRNPYEEYATSDRVVGGADSHDEQLHPKTEVLGVRYDGDAVAYPLERVSAAGVVNDTVGGRPIVVTATADDRLVAYDRRVDGELLRFTAGGPGEMVGGGTQWEVESGRAVAGTHEGGRLEPVDDALQLYWFAWREFEPGTRIYSDRWTLDWLCG